MYIDEDSIRSYNQRYMYEPDTEYLPLSYQYRQIGPFLQGPQSPQGGPPSGPPNFTPTEPKSQQFGATPLAIDSGAIRPCIYRFVYIWPRRGNGFWAWLVFVGPRSVAGFRFNRNTWRYFGMDLRDIRSFQCF
ncbi:MULTISPECIES: hypothetical protein [Clostridium]|uniref:hypothetical protein n=1 Tax=Clostridium TaxID=1485 RepID=UPI001CCC50EB|nr:MULTISPECIES: hypothetical protein [Clostridium]MBZ9633601.1 hypothetical protein [Clostridium sp. FP1]